MYRNRWYYPFVVVLCLVFLHVAPTQNLEALKLHLTRAELLSLQLEKASLEQSRQAQNLQALLQQHRSERQSEREKVNKQLTSLQQELSASRISLIISEKNLNTAKSYSAADNKRIATLEKQVVLRDAWLKVLAILFGISITFNLFLVFLGNIKKLLRIPFVGLPP